MVIDLVGEVIGSYPACALLTMTMNVMTVHTLVEMDVDISLSLHMGDKAS